MDIKIWFAENTFKIAKSFVSWGIAFKSRKYNGGFASPPRICNKSVIGKLVHVNVKNSLNQKSLDLKGLWAYRLTSLYLMQKYMFHSVFISVNSASFY